MKAQQITVVETSPSGRSVEVVYRKKKKKSSKWTRPFERIERRVLTANQKFADELIGRHNKSRNKKTDGWIWDAPSNYLKATRASYNELRKLYGDMLPKW